MHKNRYKTILKKIICEKFRKYFILSTTFGKLPLKWYIFRHDIFLTNIMDLRFVKKKYVAGKKMTTNGCKMATYES